MAGFSGGMGTNAGDAGDQYMDAPAIQSKGKKSGGDGGFNPLSAMLDLVGIHLGDKPGQNAAINSGGGNVTPTAPATSTTVAPQPGRAVVDSQGGTVGTLPSIDPIAGTQAAALSQSLANATAAVPQHQSLLGKIGQAIGGNSAADSSGPGDSEISGEAAKKQDGSLGKSIMKVLGSVIGG